MGYEAEILQKLLNIIHAQFPDFSNIKLLEFGNQEVYSNFDKVINIYHNYNYYTHTRVLKYFFESIGLQYTSIDYNGNDGALPYDVRTNLTDKLSTKYDIITNVGFSEHVGENDSESNLLLNQYHFFKNIHDLGQLNTVYYHCVPLTKYWYKHGVCDYSLDFFKELCERSNYDIIVQPFIEDYHKELQASVFYKKTEDAPFMSYEQFTHLPGLRSTYND